MMPALVSTRIGLLKPKATMLAAICATCASECVRALRPYGTSFATGHSSIRLAMACEVSGGNSVATIFSACRWRNRATLQRAAAGARGGPIGLTAVRGISGRAADSASEAFACVAVARLGTDPEVERVDRHFIAAALWTH